MEEVQIPNDSIMLNAAYYSPINRDSINGVLIVVHGSAPSTYNDVSYYTGLGTQLGMAVLAFDKRGVGNLVAHTNLSLWHVAKYGSTF